jgi:starch synthase (maltosyl-transferring)
VPPLLALDRLTAPLSCGSVCVSEGVLRFSRETVGLSANRLIVIPNGIDPEPLDRASAVPRAAIGIPDTAHLALAVGRLDPQKGLAELLAAAERVIPETPDWHLVLAGDGPCRSWLVEQIATRPILAGRVHWLGARDDVPGLLKAANLLVLASRWEGMPNVVLEAMAARRAVVATAVEGTEELVLPRQTGWLVPARDPDSLAHALLEAAREPALCQLMGQEGRDRVMRMFSLEQIVAAYERLWARILGYEIRLDTANNHATMLA